MYLLYGEYFIARCTEEQRRRGLYPGIPLSHARALYPKSQTMLFAPDWSTRLLLRLAQWASSFSPLVDIDIPPAIGPEAYAQDSRFDGFCLDITGSEKLFSGTHSLLHTLRQALHTFGFTPRIVLAPTRGCGWAISRYTKKTQAIVEPQEVYTILFPLPVAALRINERTLSALAEVQIDTIHEILSISPHSLRERFGEELLTKLRQALGHIEELITPWREEKILQAELIFESAIVDFKSILRAIRNLIQEFSNLLTKSGVVTRCFVLVLMREGLPAYEKQILLSTPSANGNHLWRLIRPHLEQVSYGNGVTGCSCKSTQTESAQFRSLSLDDNQCAQQEPPEKLLDSLIQTLGENSVCVVKHNPSHIPENTYRYATFASASPRLTHLRAFDLKFTANASKREVGLTTTHQTTPRHARPSVIFQKPQQIHAIAALPDKPPYWLKWEGKPYRISFGIGPERIEFEWWNKIETENREARDYYKVQLLSGIWLWIFKEQASLQWFVHGVWA